MMLWRVAQAARFQYGGQFRSNSTILVAPTRFKHLTEDGIRNPLRLLAVQPVINPGISLLPFP